MSYNLMRATINFGLEHICAMFGTTMDGALLCLQYILSVRTIGWFISHICAVNEHSMCLQINSATSVKCLNLCELASLLSRQSHSRDGCDVNVWGLASSDGSWNTELSYYAGSKAWILIYHSCHEFINVCYFQKSARNFDICHIFLLRINIV